jgi:hypothetical protein
MAGSKFICLRTVTIGRFLYIRLGEMWGMSGQRKDVYSYGSGLLEDPWHILSYETLSSMDLVRTLFFSVC